MRAYITIHLTDADDITAKQEASVWCVSFGQVRLVLGDAKQAKQLLIAASQAFAGFSDDNS